MKLKCLRALLATTLPVVAIGCSSGGGGRPDTGTDSTTDADGGHDPAGETSEPGAGDGDVHDARADDLPAGETSVPCPIPPCTPLPGDRDCDTIPDGNDNCPDCSNECQEDVDGDRIGNVCDPACEESCIGASCEAEGIVGCNCSSCPEGYICQSDGHNPNTLCPTLYTDYYKFCAPPCRTTHDCPAGLVCHLVGSNCLCARPSMTTPLCPEPDEASPDP
jgi:hypothetical protein